MEDNKRHTFSVLVENKFGVLSRVVGLFSGRGYNIISLTVNATHDPTVSQMTIVTSGDQAVLEQIEKQLNKLVDVIAVSDLSEGEFVARELMLIKLAANGPAERSGILQLAEIFRGTVVAVTQKSLTVELAGTTAELDNFVELVRDYRIIRMARSGQVAIKRNSDDN